MATPAAARPNLLRWGVPALVALYAAYWLAGRPDPALLGPLWFLPGIGVLGAIIANTSGTGGGVVFVPVFAALRSLGTIDLAPLQITAASFAIQSIGMSMGALRWTDRLLHQPASPLVGGAPVRGRDFAIIVAAVLALSLPAMLATQRLAPFDGHAVLLAYKAFSIALGTALVTATWTVNRARPERSALARGDLLVLLLLAGPGGFVTAYFSVGIGELVALYLFIRHYPVLLCTGTACVISAVSVLAGLAWHWDAGSVPWAVVVLAAPGAALGGYLARPIALWLGARRLKTLDGLWIVGSSLYLVWLAA